RHVLLAGRRRPDSRDRALLRRGSRRAPGARPVEHAGGFPAAAIAEGLRVVAQALLGAAVIRALRKGGAWLAAGGLLAAASASAEPYYLIVAGLGGEPRFDERFAEQAEKLAEAARRTAGTSDQVVVLKGEDATQDNVRAAFGKLAATLSSTDSLIVFLIGHGSFDGDDYKLNLPGPDITGKALGELLAGVPAGAQLVMNSTSASGAVLEPWTADGRTVITATRSGAERTATRFAEHWIAALSTGEADVDKNGLISAQEAFDYASRRVADSYESEGTLATEHPQIAGENAARFTVA